MISRIFLTGLAALVHAGLASADDHVSCQWVPDGSLCIASVDSPAGKNFTAFQLQLAICGENIGANGCAEDLTGLCKSVPITGLGQSACLPELAPDAISAQDAIKLPEIQTCVGDTSPQCNDVRTTFYGVLNCMECAAPANEAAAIEESCIAAQTKAACAAASPEAGAPKPAAPAPAAPAPAPAEVPAVVPAPAAAPAPAPEEPVAGAVEEEAEDGAAAVEGATDEGAAVEMEEASSAAATTAAFGLLAAAAAALL